MFYSYVIIIAPPPPQKKKKKKKIDWWWKLIIAQYSRLHYIPQPCTRHPLISDTPKRAWWNHGILLCRTFFIWSTFSSPWLLSVPGVVRTNYTLGNRHLHSDRQLQQALMVALPGICILFSLISNIGNTRIYQENYEFTLWLFLVSYRALVPTPISYERDIAYNT